MKEHAKDAVLVIMDTWLTLLRQLKKDHANSVRVQRVFAMVETLFSQDSLIGGIIGRVTTSKSVSSKIYAWGKICVKQGIMVYCVRAVK